MTAVSGHTEQWVVNVSIDGHVCALVVHGPTSTAAIDRVEDILLARGHREVRVNGVWMFPAAMYGEYDAELPAPNIGGVWCTGMEGYTS